MDKTVNNNLGEAKLHVISQYWRCECVLTMETQNWEKKQKYNVENRARKREDIHSTQ